MLAQISLKVCFLKCKQENLFYRRTNLHHTTIKNEAPKGQDAGLTNETLKNNLNKEVKRLTDAIEKYNNAKKLQYHVEKYIKKDKNNTKVK